jgi:hypothetical protein
MRSSAFEPRTAATQNASQLAGKKITLAGIPIVLVLIPSFELADQAALESRI